MANPVFSSVTGRFVRYCDLALGTDQLVIVLLKAAGLQADATLRNYTALSTLLGSNTEATFTNYARKVVTSGITVTTDTTNHKNTVALAGWTWTAAGGASNDALGKLLVCWRPTSGTADSGCIQLFAHDLTVTTTGSDLIVSIAGPNNIATATAA